MLPPTAMGRRTQRQASSLPSTHVPSGKWFSCPQALSPSTMTSCSSTEGQPSVDRAHLHPCSTDQPPRPRLLQFLPDYSRSFSPGHQNGFPPPRLPTCLGFRQGQLL